MERGGGGKVPESIVDYIIAGGGAAGLGLAYHMAMSSLRGQSVLIVDRDAKERNDRTWCFWTDRPTRYDHLVYHSWDQVEVVNHHFREKYDLRPYQYKMIRGIDYYQGIREALSIMPEIQFLRGRVSEMSDTKDNQHAQVMVDRVPYGARYVFDSIFKATDYFQGPGRYHYLKQHFKGWEIVTPKDCFDPSTATLFDFRTPQQGSMRFFYILPFTRKRALVEYTLFSADMLKAGEYDRAISEYLEKVRGISNYRVDAVETGVIPMTDRPFRRRVGERILAIGTKGGLVKPSSGYAFLRMQNDAAAIVKSLINYGDPFHLPATPARYRLFDTVMLQVMYRRGDLMANIFTRMFHKNAVQDIFRFLDETAPLTDNVRLISSLPTAPFLNALFRVKLLRKV